VRIFDGRAKMISSFLAYNNNFQKGLAVALSDIDGDGLMEIMTAAGPGGGPHVRVFEVDGELRKSWYVYNPLSSSGVNIAPLNLSRQFIN